MIFVVLIRCVILFTVFLFVIVFLLGTLLEIEVEEGGLAFVFVVFFVVVFLIIIVTVFGLILWVIILVALLVVVLFVILLILFV